MDDCDQTSNMQKGSVKKMNKAFVIIDIQNDITKNYRDIIDKINCPQIIRDDWII